jgi:hypothetical protein
MTTKCQRNRQLRAVAEVDQLAPLGLRQAAQRVKTRTFKTQGIEDRLRVDGNVPGGFQKARPTASKTSER